MSEHLSDEEKEMIISMSGNKASDFYFRNAFNGGESIRVYGIAGNRRDNKILLFEEIDMAPPPVDLGG